MQTSFGSIQYVAPALTPNIELGMPGMGGPIVTGGGVIFIAAAIAPARDRLPATGRRLRLTDYYRFAYRQN